MFAKSYINNIILPRTEINPGPPQISVTLNGADEYIDVINEDVVKIFNNEEYNGIDDWNEPGSGAQFKLTFWVKFAGDNTAGNDSVLFHNGLAGNDAFKIYKPDGSNLIKTFMGDGDGDGNTENSGTLSINEWVFISVEFFKSNSIRRMLTRVNYQLSGNSILSDIYTANNTDDHFTLGCYRAGLSGTPANFLNGEIAQATLVAAGVGGVTTYMMYNVGMGYDWNNSPFSDSVVMNMQFGDMTISQAVDGSDNDGGGNDGDDNLILFDSAGIRKSARSDRASNKGIQGSMASGDFTLSNGFSVPSGGGLDSTLLRLGIGQTSSGVATFDGFTPVVGRLYKVEITYNVTTASGDGNDTITFAGSTIYSGTSNTTVVTTTKWVKASNTNKLVITAHSDSDATTTISVLNFRIWEYDKYGIMVNMTQSSNLGRIVQGPQGGHITP